MEHSRLLKFLIEERQKTTMSEPTIKIQKDYENPTNISAEVPGEQKIREMDTKEDTENEITDTDNAIANVEVTETEFTLSPVITVTKNETTLTKGDMKLQKVTVTEDISRQEFSNGDYQVSYTEFQTTVQTNKQIITETLMSGEYTEPASAMLEKEKESKSLEQKKSKIPKLKFRQTVERVKRERREEKSKAQTSKEQQKQPQSIPRRSSIPKLKDAKLVKKQASLKHDWKFDEPSEKEKVAEEFDKLYQEIVDNKQKDVDDKILAVKIDDPEKIETKFDEIIHAYDSNDDNYLTQTEKLRASKIPWRRKDSDRSTRLSSLVEKVTNKPPGNMNLKDGGFKVSAATITTKRFSRGNSTDLSNPRVEVFETIDVHNGKDNNVIKETITREIIEGIPVKTITTLRSIDREKSQDNSDITNVDKEVVITENTKPIEITEDEYKEIREKISKQVKSGIPKKPERLKRNISRDLNKRPATLDDRDFVNKEVIKHQELIDGKNKTIIKEVNITGKPITTEKITRGISRTFSRDGKSVTVSAKSKNVEDSKIPVADISIQELNKPKLKDSSILKESNVITEPEINLKKETLTTEKIAKESVKIGIPVYTKVTHTYTKGTVHNVEMSKTIEWKPADEIRIKRYGRSQSENNNSNTKITIPKPRDKTVMNDKIVKESITTPTKVQTISNLKIETHSPTTNIDNETTSIATNGIPTPTTNIEIVTDIVSGSSEPSNESIEITKESIHKVVDITNTKPPIEDIDSMKNVTILKGNVNRIISQISVNENKDMPKKEIDIKDDLPKKKSVLSKIAMFEGKEPLDFNIKVKKCTLDKKITTFESKDQITEAVNQVYMPQVKTNTMNIVNRDEISESDNLTSDLGSEPIIVDQIWKFREQDVQNDDEVVYRARVVSITPETVDFSISEDANTSLENIDILPEKVVHDANEVQTANKLLQKESEMNTLPARIDFIADENQENIVKYSPEKLVASNNSQTELNKPRVGKLNLNFWKKQVEDNKKFVGTGKPIEQGQVKIEKVRSPDKHINVIKSTEVEVPNSHTKIDITPDSTHKSPIIVPSKINLMTNNNQGYPFARPTNLPGKLDTATSESLLQVHVVLPETPLMKPDEGNYETEKDRHIQIPVILPGKLKVTSKIEMFEHLKASSLKDASVIPENTGIRIKEYTEFNKPKIEHHQIRSPVFTPVKTDDENPILSVTAKINEQQIDNNAKDHQLYIQKNIPENEIFKIEETKPNAKAGIEVSLGAPYEINFGSISTTTISPEPKDKKKDNAGIDWSKRLDQTDYKMQYKQMKSPQIQAEATNFNINHNIFDFKNEPEPINFNTVNQSNTPNSPGNIDKSESKSDAATEIRQIEISKEKNTEVGSIHITPHANTNLSKDKDHLYLENVSFISKGLKPLQISKNNYYADTEIPSDPELVDSEPEIKETKETIMGKLKNKIYLITSKKMNQKKHRDDESSPQTTPPPTPETASIIEDYNKTIYTYNKTANTDTSNTKYEFERSDSKVAREIYEFADKCNENKLNQKETIGDERLPQIVPPRTPENATILDDFNKNRNTDKNNIQYELRKSDSNIASSLEARGSYDFVDRYNSKKINQKKTLDDKRPPQFAPPPIPEIANILENYNTTKNTENNNTTYEYLRFDSKTVSGFVTRDNYEFLDVVKSDFESNQDMKKAKSLAELDLGDAVKGQVQRMVYRIKSVDFDKLETNKSNKINNKEMPKKSSVLEKIALFEGKAASRQPPRYSKPLRMEKREMKTASTSFGSSSSVISNENQEEIFLKKVEDLSTAKLRYEKTEMEYVELGNGVRMPIIALGTALMDKNLIQHIVGAAIDLGFRAIDTAYIYSNEKEIGEAIKKKIDDGTVERKDLFIISKLWSTFHRPDLVETVCRASLEALGLEYFDLYLIHNPMSFKEGGDVIPKIASVLQFSDYDYLDAWFAMEALLQKGLVRSIGVSNFNSKQIQRILDKRRITPVVNQVECHPYLSQDRLQDFCADHNINLNCFGTLGSKGTPEEYKTPGIISAIDDPLVKVMASALNVSAARLLVSYQLQSGRTVVVKASSSAHLWDILQALNFKFKQSEVDALNALNRNQRIFTFKGMGDTHKNYPFREPY